MSYKTKYSSSIWDFSGNTYNVNLKLSGYTGTSISIYSYAVSPVVIKYDSGSKDEIDLNVHGSGCDFTFYVNDSTNYDEIFSSDYKTWQLEVSGSTLYWIGFVKPENFVRPFLKPYNYFITVNAVDGLADLKNIDFRSTGQTTLIGAIKYCLNQTGLNLPVYDQLNITESIGGSV